MGQYTIVGLRSGGKTMPVVSNTLDGLTRTIQVLQQLQRLLPISATLADVAELLACIQAEYGAGMLLEDVIQLRVGEHLKMQFIQRGVAHHMELEVAA